MWIFSNSEDEALKMWCPFQCKIPQEKTKAVEKDFNGISSTPVRIPFGEQNADLRGAKEGRINGHVSQNLYCLLLPMKKLPVYIFTVSD